MRGFLKIYFKRTCGTKKLNLFTNLILISIHVTIRSISRINTFAYSFIDTLLKLWARSKTTSLHILIKIEEIPG